MSIDADPQSGFDVPFKKDEKGHIKRLRKEKCTTDVGVVFVDILFNCEGIIDHCVNVSECIAQSEELAQT